jgi:hypothetical protein
MEVVSDNIECPYSLTTAKALFNELYKERKHPKREADDMLNVRLEESDDDMDSGNLYHGQGGGDILPLLTDPRRGDHQCPRATVTGHDDELGVFYTR